ncbi:hypothetical protein JCM10212_006065, partial [Sporobolomyces blumeae]
MSDLRWSRLRSLRLPGSTSALTTLRHAVLVAGTAALGGASYAVSRQQAEIRAEPSPAPRFARPESVEHHRSSLPLYEKPSEPIELVPVKSPLQDEVAQARAFVQEATKGLRTTTDGGKQAWLDWERKAEG